MLTSMGLFSTDIIVYCMFLFKYDCIVVSEKVLIALSPMKYK